MPRSYFKKKKSSVKSFIDMCIEKRKESSIRGGAIGIQ